MTTASLDFLVPGDPLTATGGYEYDRRIIEGLRDLGWTVRLHTLDGSFPAPTAHALDDAQQQLTALPADSLVVIDGLALGAMPALAQRHAERLRLIGLVHHPLATETGLGEQRARELAAMERDALQAVRQVIVTSHATARALHAYDVTAQRIAIVEPGVDQPPNAGLEVPTHRQEGPVRLLCVATLTPRKGHNLLVDALAELRDLDWVLNCVGDSKRSPETTRALIAQIAAAGLRDRIVLTGELDAAALARQFRDADLFVLATRHEGYGMAIAQALTFGLPVISTHTGAITELVTEHAGVLINPDDAAGLRDALADVLLEPALRLRLAAGASRAGAKMPDWRTAGRRFSAVLCATAADARLSRPSA